MDLLAAQDENGINRICFKSLICCFCFLKTLVVQPGVPLLGRDGRGVSWAIMLVCCLFPTSGVAACFLPRAFL